MANQAPAQVPVNQDQLAIEIANNERQEAELKVQSDAVDEGVQRCRIVLESLGQLTHEKTVELTGLQNRQREIVRQFAALGLRLQQLHHQAPQ